MSSAASIPKKVHGQTVKKAVKNPKKAGCRYRVQIPSGRCRARTSDLLLVSEKKRGDAGKRAGIADTPIACKSKVLDEWLSDGGDLPLSG